MLISFTTKLIRTITLSRVIIWSLSALLAVVFFTIYENRDRIVTTITAPEIPKEKLTTFDVSESTKTRIREIVEQDKIILGVIISSADLRVNEMLILDWYATSPTLSVVGDAVTKSADLRRLPLFSSIDTANSNVISLINGQFVCQDFSDTVLTKIYPEMAAEVKATCAASIPSYYGYFSGTVTMLLSQKPTYEKQQQLKLVAEKLSNDIYFFDIGKNKRAAP